MAMENSGCSPNHRSYESGGVSKMINRIKVSENFYLNEFECNDGSHLVKLDSELLHKLQQLRTKLGRSIKINSGYRTPEHNKKVGGSPNSQHLLGTAADIVVSGINPIIVMREAILLGFKGVKAYSTFTHVDVRKELKNTSGRSYDTW
jgi:uncharacterized protein YcbK (DUF882 family)